MVGNFEKSKHCYFLQIRKISTFIHACVGIMGQVCKKLNCEIQKVRLSMKIEPLNNFPLFMVCACPVSMLSLIQLRECPRLRLSALACHVILETRLHQISMVNWCSVHHRLVLILKYS